MKIFRHFWFWMRRRDLEHDLNEEVRQHLELKVQENIARGMSPDEAYRQARAEFGNPTLAKEHTRQSWGFPFFESVLYDMRFAMRQLRKSAGFAVVAVLTLALGIGANAVVFSVLNAMILRPINLPEAQSLYSIERTSDHSTAESYPNYLDLRDRNHSFDDLAGVNLAQAALDTGKGPSLVWLAETSGNYFDALRIQPHIGRFFHAADEHGPNSAPYIVLSYGFWHSQFQDDRRVVGRVVQLNKHPYTIVGVVPPEFHGSIVFVHPEFYVPMVDAEQVEGLSHLTDRATRWVFIMEGHLKAGVTPAQAIADLNSVGTDLEKSYPKENARMSFSLIRPGLFGFRRPLQQFLTALTLLAGLILLAACANLGSLFAARTADRAREVALRLALGAGRPRILRQLFTEAVLISLIGGATGLWISVLLLSWLSTWRPFGTFPGYMPVQADASVYGLALLLALLSGFLFGAVPVKQILRTDPYQIVKSGSAGMVGRRITMREVLLGLQIAICAVLVTSSIVAVRGLVRSLHSNFGFEPQNAMVVQTDLVLAGYSGDRVAETQKRMTDALQAIPGVAAVGVIDQLPLDTQHTEPVFSDKTTDFRPANAAAADVDMCSISPEYFHAAGTTLLSGRSFNAHDDKNSPRVAVVNEQFARMLFGSVESAVGSYYKMRDGVRVQVVGVVQDGKYTSLTEDQQPAMFVPILQWPATQTSFVVRSQRDPEQLGNDIRKRLGSVDAGLPLQVGTWKGDLDPVLFPSKVASVSLGVLGVIAAILSITGIFGMAAHSVSKRLRELGIRIALGAQRPDVLKAALGRAFKLLGFGSAAGFILGILASRVLAFIVYQATPRDPVVLAGAVLAMALLGLLATWIPARRALRVDPLILLREE